VSRFRAPNTSVILGEMAFVCLASLIFADRKLSVIGGILQSSHSGQEFPNPQELDEGEI